MAVALQLCMQPLPQYAGSNPQWPLLPQQAPFMHGLSLEHVYGSLAEDEASRASTLRELAWVEVIKRSRKDKESSSRKSELGRCSRDIIVYSL